MSTISKYEQMWESLRDPEFRKQLIDEHVNVGIAFQIRSLRNRQKLTQTDLAGLMNVKQPLVSAWENPNYGKYTLGTLKDLAKAFDVGLLVRFVPFSTSVNWTINVTPNVMAPPSFSEEQNMIAPLVSVDYNPIDTKDMDAYKPLMQTTIPIASTANTVILEKEPAYV